MVFKPLPIVLLATLAVTAAAVPMTLQAGRTNPLPASIEIVAKGGEHFAARCAQCHAPDGSGTSKSVQIDVPDLRAAGTQSLSDDELFFIMENSGADGPEQIWQLVHFVRSLPQQTRAGLATSASPKG